MRYGAHLPVLDFGTGVPFALPDLKEYARSAERLGYETLTVNDHFVFSRPWLDGLTALAAVLGETRDIKLGTSVALPVVRGPVALAKSLGALDLLSGGRLTIGVGPGSSAGDYAAVGIDYAERWQRLDEAVSCPSSAPARRRSTRGQVLLPRWTQAGARADTAGRTAHLDRQLGIEGRPRARRQAG